MIKAVRGMKDLLPPETARWHHMETIARAVFACYGFQEIRLPLLERTELFTRSIGTSTDIVEKEMYTFHDRRGESMTLRPEATASVVRAFIENHLDQGAEVKKFFTIGPMFRYERPQKGRYRQFHQINCEVLGGEAPELDAEMILMLMEMLGRLQITDIELVINSLGCPICRPAYLMELTALFAAWFTRFMRRLPAPQRHQSFTGFRLQVENLPGPAYSGSGHLRSTLRHLPAA